MFVILQKCLNVDWSHKEPVFERFQQSVYTYVTGSVVFNDTLNLCAVAFSDVTISEVTLIFVTGSNANFTLKSAFNIYLCTWERKTAANLDEDIIRETLQRDVYDASKKCT
ncbi:hypothetical protein DPMN_080171 [Dreissena polymorpha]|uniref:Uncharacterized protein n=1 Tax=Dreissena polymorpha TaxID=45954 RepID=A0A9D4BRQ7_DREPO|nr:hypothetical protein DPMN_080171 [Dreissena polymorpha]